MAVALLCMVYLKKPSAALSNDSRSIGSQELHFVATTY